MVDEYVVKHYEHVSNKSFEEVVNAFEAAVGDGDDGKFLNGMKALSNVQDWENLCKSSFGPSGFLHVLTFDHGHWLKFYGIGGKAKQYTYGNPLLAHTMVKHDIGVCFQVPFRILIYETAKGGVRIAYDLPSTLMARLHNDEVNEAACKIDPKVVAFVTKLAGAPA
jgi:uncharacterized protein (DUF302 family)